MSRPLPLAAIACAVAAQLACQAPFGAQRDDLVGDRVVALSVRSDTDPTIVVPSVWLIADGHLWVDDPITLYWAWLDPLDPDVDAVETTGTLAGLGPGARLRRPHPGGTDVLGLVAQFPNGAERRAILTLDGGPVDPQPEITGLRIDAVDRPGVAATTEDDLPIDARAGWPTTPTDALELDTWARLTPEFPREPEPSWRTRWLASAGTFQALDRTTADWAPAEASIDGGELDWQIPLLPQVVRFMALTFDGAGGPAVGVRDAWVGPAWRPGVWFGDQWLSAEGPVPDTTRALRGTLVADDASPTGLGLTDIVAVAADDLQGPDPYGTASLACAPDAGPFDPTWLATGWCTRTDVIGATVVGVAP